LISFIGAGLGIAGATLATRWMASNTPEAFSLPRVQDVSVDGRVLMFAAAVTVGTAIMFGLFPAVKAARTSPAGTLGEESRGPSQRTGAVRDLLVISEVGLSVVLLAGAALFARSFSTLMNVDDGLEVEQVMVGRVNLGGAGYPSDQEKVAFFEELMGRLATTPGVEAAGGTTFLPMDGLGAATGYWVTDRPVPAPEDRPAADVRNVTGDYFGAMGIELLQGRLFDSRDAEDGPQTIVVSRSLARMYWPEESPIGKQIVVNWVDDEPWDIVGVVEDVRMNGPEVEAREVVYINYAKGAFFPWLHVTVRGSGDPVDLTSIVRRELAEMDATLPLGSARLMQDIVGRSVARPRMTRALMLVFAALATLLAAVGLYGVLAYSVSRRLREIGVRIALGAEPTAVVRLVVAQGFRLVLIGLSLGAGGALVASRFVASLLYETSPADPWALGSAAGILALVGVLACLVPAWRAAHVAPTEALRPD
jgi:putative ABC transport system permease protein